LTIGDVILGPGKRRALGRQPLRAVMDHRLRQVYDHPITEEASNDRDEHR
jgi:hypothetical protein